MSEHFYTYPTVIELRSAGPDPAPRTTQTAIGIDAPSRRRRIAAVSSDPRLHTRRVATRVRCRTAELRKMPLTVSDYAGRCRPAARAGRRAARRPLRHRLPR